MKRFYLILDQLFSHVHSIQGVSTNMRKKYAINNAYWKVWKGERLLTQKKFWNLIPFQLTSGTQFSIFKNIIGTCEWKFAVWWCLLNQPNWKESWIEVGERELWFIVNSTYFHIDVKKVENNKPFCYHAIFIIKNE